MLSSTAVRGCLKKGPTGRKYMSQDFSKLRPRPPHHKALKSVILQICTKGITLKIHYLPPILLLDLKLDGLAGKDHIQRTLCTVDRVCTLVEYFEWGHLSTLKIIKDVGKDLI